MYYAPTSEGTTLCADALVVVQPHKTLDKKARVVKAYFGHLFEYTFGRIQITLPRELVGTQARVRIEFPDAPRAMVIAFFIMMSSYGYYQYSHNKK